MHIIIILLAVALVLSVCALRFAYVAYQNAYRASIAYRNVKETEAAEFFKDNANWR